MSKEQEKPLKPSTRQQLRQLAVAHKGLLESLPEALHLPDAAETARKASIAVCDAIIGGRNVA